VFPSSLKISTVALQQIGPLKNLTLKTGFIPTTDQETELSGPHRPRFDSKPKRHAALRLYNTRNVNDAFNTDEPLRRTARGSSYRRQYP